MKTIKVILGDNANHQYKKEIELIISTYMHRCLKDIDDVDEYDRAWDELCDMISDLDEELPEEWFIDGIKF
jgi:hypothetical protein